MAGESCSALVGVIAPVPLDTTCDLGPAVTAEASSRSADASRPSDHAGLRPSPAAAPDISAAGSHGSLARESALGQSAEQVLAELQREGRLRPEEVDGVLKALDAAFLEELDRLPRFWHLQLRGRLDSYRLLGGRATLDVADARVHASGAIFYDVPLLVSAALPPSSTKPGKRRRLDSTSGAARK
eukprot:TRINITY_DN56923_c0_g1_i1.p1 TRINITY_DN56923_c0_g1~~TRINITY_DN56923_c0_g1_i1.p1  ORF type:complete len:199 (+),score=37.43 TRINITY_DN56923_c0_g1_i1:44-598(+)